MAETINLICNLVLVGLIVIVVVASLIGLWKGLWKTSFKLIFRSILLVIMIFCSQPITSALCSFNIHSAFNANININGILFTSLDETLANLLMKTAKISPIVGYDLYGTCMLLSHSILSCVIFLVLTILTLLIGSLLSTILYHLVFKYIVPKKVRKKKIRIAGLLCGLLDGILCCVMFVSPLQSLANTAINAQTYVVRSHELNVIDDDTYKLFMDGISGYSSSALNSTLNVLSPMTDGMMNKVVEVEINGMKMGLFAEVETMLELFEPLLPALNNSNGSLSLDYQTLLLKETVGQLLTMLSSSKLMISLIPGLISMGQNIIDDKSVVEVIEKLDFSDINWKDDITALNIFYEKIYDAGLFDRVTSDKLDLVIYLNNIDQYQDALNSITSLSVINNNMSIVMAIMAETLNRNLGAEVFPCDISAYENIDWSHDLSLLISGFTKVFKAMEIKSFDNINFSELLNTALKDQEKLELIKEAFCGSLDSEGILDLQLISAIDINTLIYNLILSVPSLGQYVDEDDIYQALNEDLDLKKELDVIFDIVPLVYNNSKLPLDKIDLNNVEQISELKKVVTKASKSQLLLSIFPKLVKSALNSANISSDMLFGLSIDDLNFQFDSASEMEREINKILDTVSDAMNISSSLNAEGGSMSETIGKIDVVKLENVLINIYTSSITNPSHRVDGSDKIQHDQNFNNLIKGLLSEKSIEDLGVVVPNNLNNIEWYNESTKTGEIKNIIEAFKVVQKYLDFFSKDSVSFDDIDGVMIKDLLKGLGMSEVFSPSLASIFNKNVTPIIKDLGVTLDFSVVTDWENEGECFEKIINSLKALTKTGGLDNIDWLNSDLDRVNAILTAFSKTKVMGINQMSSGLYFDNFGELLAKVFTNESFKDVLGSSINSGMFQTCDPKTGMVNKGWTWIETTSVKKILDEEIELTESGEIANLLKILKTIKEAGVDNITSDTIGAEQLKSILLSFTESNTLSIVIADMIKSAIKNVAPITLDEDNTIDLTQLNTDVLYTMNRSELQSEVEYLVDIYDQFVSGTFNSMFDEITNLTEDQLTTLKRILDDFACLETFMTPKPNELLCLQEKVLSSLFNYIQLDQMITNHVVKDDMSVEMKHTVKMRAKTSMQSILTSITNWLDETDVGGEVIIQENSKIIRLLRRLNGIKLGNINTFKNLTPDQVESILSCLNDSKLLHQALPTFIEQAFEAFNIELLTTIEGKKYFDINYRVHLTTSKEDMDFWDHELVGFMHLTRNLYDELSNEYIDSSGLGFNTSVFDIYNVLGPIDEMYILNENKEYIVLSYLMNTGSELKNLIRDLSSGLREHEKAGRIRKLFFNYGHTQEDLKKQCEILNKFLKDLYKMLDVSFDKNNLEITGQQAYDFIMSTTMIEDNDGVVSATKSLFACEIVGHYFNDGFSKIITSDSALKDKISTFFFDRDRFGYEYFRLNIVEARGAKGLLEFSKATSLKDMAKAIKMMGAYPKTVEDMTLAESGYMDTEVSSLELYKSTAKLYYSDYSVKRSDVNSQLAFLLFNQYMPDDAVFKSFYSAYLTQECDGDINNLVFEDLAYSIENYDISNPTHIPTNPNKPL